MNTLTIKKNWVFTFALLWVLSACHVMFIGAYDQVTDESIQKIQNDVSTVMVKLERNIDDNDTAANNYENFKTTYENIEGEIESLKIRTGSLPKYQIITDQVNLLRDNIKDLENVHKQGITNKQTVETIKSTFEIAFRSMIVLQNGLKRKK